MTNWIRGFKMVFVYSLAIMFLWTFMFAFFHGGEIIFNIKNFGEIWIEFGVMCTGLFIMMVDFILESCGGKR
jgi:hypothetical protein